MLDRIQLAFVVTAVARAQLRKFLNEIRDYPAIPALFWSRNTDSGDWGWSIGFYDTRMIDGPDFRGVLIETGDLQFVSAQRDLAVNLQGMVLDWQGSQFVIVPAPKH